VKELREYVAFHVKSSRRTNFAGGTVSGKKERAIKGRPQWKRKNGKKESLKEKKIP